MKYTSGTNAPPAANRPPVTLRWSKYRGPGKVTFDKAKPPVEKLAAAKRAVQRQGDDDANVQRAGRLRAARHRNDYSGDGGGGFGCCWTTALIKVDVK